VSNIVIMEVTMLEKEGLRAFLLMVLTLRLIIRYINNQCVLFEMQINHLKYIGLLF